MGKVRIDDWAFGEGRLGKLGFYFEGGEAQALGTLVFLWHESQEAFRTAGSEAEIMDWCRIYDAEQRKKVFEGLVATRYISKKKGGKTGVQFEIRGNKIRLNQKTVWADRSAIGGRATHEKFKKYRENANVTRGFKPSIRVQGSGTRVQVPGLMSQVPENREIQIQCELQKTEPPRSEPAVVENLAFNLPGSETPEPEKITRAPTPLWATWVAYREAFHERYGFDPPVGANDKAPLGKIKTFLSKIPAEAGPSVVKFYVEHCDAFYIRSQHSLEPMISQAAALYTQWKTGRQMLSTESREIERRQHNTNSFDEAFALLAERGIRFAGT